MGQKVSPTGLRIGVNKDWESKWMAPKKDVAKYLNNYIKIRKYLEIGRGGEGITKLKSELKTLVGEDIQVSIADVKDIDLNAQLVAQSIATQIENRAPFRVAEKKAIRNAMKAGAKGIKTLVSGRLNGVEMARSEGYSEGNIPLHTIRADIDYGFAEALTTYGKLGVKVWIYKGEILPAKAKKGGNN